jgi:hypothetical protein
VIDPQTYLAAFLVGLLGGVHCVGMCGGLVGALTMGIARPSQGGVLAILPFNLAYNLGRVASYTLAGALMGGLGVLLVSWLPVYHAQRVLLGLAGIFMVLLGLYLGGWWPGLVKIEALGGALWRRIEPWGRRLLPVRSPRQALLLGLLWGWLPCGLVYSVLIWSVSAGSVVRGALLMLAFGLGTLPNLLAMGLLASTIAAWSRKPMVRRAAGATVAVLGLYTLWRLV